MIEMFKDASDQDPVTFQRLQKITECFGKAEAGNFCLLNAFESLSDAIKMKGDPEYQRSSVFMASWYLAAWTELSNQYEIQKEGKVVDYGVEK